MWEEMRVLKQVRAMLFLKLRKWISEANTECKNNTERYYLPLLSHVYSPLRIWATVRSQEALFLLFSSDEFSEMSLKIN